MTAQFPDPVYATNGSPRRKRNLSMYYTFNITWAHVNQNLFRVYYSLVKNIIQMSHRCHTMVDGTEFWISCQWLASLSILSRWQLFQNSVLSTIVWRQCAIWINNPNCLTDITWYITKRLERFPEYDINCCPSGCL